jgi:hypothetical protein
MTLKFRPAGLGSGIDKDRPDYTVFSGEWEIGRVYQTRGGPDSLRNNGDRSASGMGRGSEDATGEVGRLVISLLS